MTVNKRSLFVVALSALLGGVIYYATLFRPPSARAENEQASLSEASSSKQVAIAASAASRGDNNAPGSPVPSSVMKAGRSQEVWMDFEDLSSEFGQGGVAKSFYALSKEEADWMDSQGVMTITGDLYKAYANLDIDEISRLAKQGDVKAAVHGARKLQLMALKQLSKADREALLHGTDSERREVAKRLFDSQLWVKRRELLWDAVTYGSSIAAEMMSQSYITTLSMTCVDADLYGAWSMVSWRMGNWDIAALVQCNESGPNWWMSMQVANQLWDRINYLRHEKGLGPLALNQRPNRAEWLKLRLDPRKQVPVYRR